jgi:hypothetical protein
MKAKVARKSTDKPKEPFLGLLTPKEIERGAASFRTEVNSKKIRLGLLKEKNNLKLK